MCSKNKGYLHKLVVQGVVNPGSCTDVVVSTATNDIKNLTQGQLIIFWGFVNYVGENSVNVLRNVVSFIQSNSHTDITLLPQRFEFRKSFCYTFTLKSWNPLVNASSVMGVLNFYLNILEHSGPRQVCNGTAIPLL